MEIGTTFLCSKSEAIKLVEQAEKEKGKILNELKAFINGDIDISIYPVENVMGFWLEQDVLHYIKAYDLPWCSVYGELSEVMTNYKRKPNKPTGKLRFTGEQRTGCLFCLFGAHLDKEPRLERVKLNYPRHYKMVANLGFPEVLEYVMSKGGES